MKPKRITRALLLIPLLRRSLCRALVDLRREIAGGMSLRQLKSRQDAIAGLRESLAYYRSLIQRAYRACAA